VGGRASKAKGASGEREVVGLFQTAGWPDARRSGVSGQQDGDICNVDPFVIEVKRREKLDIPAAWRQVLEVCPPDKYPLVIHRSSKQAWLVTLTLEDFHELLPGERVRSRRVGPISG